METEQNPDMRTAMAKVKPSTVTEIIPSMVGRTSALASANAPFIFFDVATSFGVNGGVAAITVEAIRHLIGPDGPTRDLVVTAHLRMSMDALRQLRDAIDDIEQIVQPVGDGPVN